MSPRKKTDRTGDGPPFYEAVYRLARKIPKGRVMTYGQIATILGHPRAARAVGYAMRACDDYAPDVPWQRVINRNGQISRRADQDGPVIQRELLEDEGIEFGADDTCDLKRYRWEPPNPEEYLYETLRDMPFG